MNDNQRIFGHVLLFLVLGIPLVVLSLMAKVVVASGSDLDPTFDGDGVAVPFSGEDANLREITIQQDGKIVLAGYSEHPSGPDQGILARLNTDGSLDTTFGLGGIVSLYNGEQNRFRALSIQDDGKIVTGGNRDTNLLLARYNSNGVLDSTFGHDGVMTTTLQTQSYIRDLTIHDDGTIAVSGVGGEYGMLVAQFSPIGTHDTSYGDNGVVFFPFSRFLDSPSLDIQADGKIVAGGLYDGSNRDFVVTRMTTDGVLDGSFAGNGFDPFDLFGVDNWLYDSELQNDGKVVLGGYTESGGLTHTLVRHNTDGTLDTSFNGSGYVMTTVPGGSGYAIAIEFQDDGKIVTASGPNFTVVRHNIDGSLDTTFGSMGFSQYQYDSYTSVKTLAIQNDGKIIVAGRGGASSSGVVDWVVVRLQAPLPTAVNLKYSEVEFVSNVYVQSMILLIALSVLSIIGYQHHKRYKSYRINLELFEK